jgi:nitrate/TMAO reductase-like tetraheme cytochrome c subunit
MIKSIIFVPWRLISCISLVLGPALAVAAAMVSPGQSDSISSVQTTQSVFYGSPGDEAWLVAQSGDLLLDDAADSDSLLLDDDDSLLSNEKTKSDDDLLLDDSELLDASEPAVKEEEKSPAETLSSQANQLHQQVLLDNRFPSAKECRKCHEDHYREWSVSPHAYAQLSPVFNAMSAKIVQLTNGTQGDFCIRCHTPVGMILEEPVYMANSKRHPTSREGITCIVCHRVNENYGRISSRIDIKEGSIFDTVYGPLGNKELKRVLQDPKYKVVTEEGERGRPIHKEVEKFSVLTTPGFCGSCHDVLFPNGFRLEDAFSEYKASPAAKRGETCQDCHMGITPGVASGYREAPAASVGGVDTLPRKRTNHMFVGPDYSIVHPGIYPHNSKAQTLATIDEWIQFDYKAGWGTDQFENNVPDDYPFPERWDNIDDRYDARVILEDQFKLLNQATEDRLKILRAGYVIGEIEVPKADDSGIDFRVMVKNGTDGHGVPTGFDAERLVFLQITVTDKEGKVVFRSGDLDPNGDIRDLHSLYVHNGELPLDTQLFSLQSKFITRNIRGSEREQVLAVNYSLDPLPFVRPATLGTILLGRPIAARKQKMNIRSGQHRWADYHVEAGELTSTGPYSANIKLIAGMVPVNLIAEIQDVGFDYGMSPREVADRVLEGHLVLWEYDVPLIAGKVIKP